MSDEACPNSYCMTLSAFGVPFDADDSQDSSLEIEYNLADADDVTITITDVDGQCSTATFKLDTIRRLINRLPEPLYL